MVVNNLMQKFGDEVALFSDRQEGVDPDVIAPINTKKIIVPEKFRADVEALEGYIDSGLTSGICISVSLSELLTVCPRSRHRVDAYDSLTKFLREEMNVTLTIKTSKSKEL